MNNAASSNCKNEKDRSNKSGVCGGHNANNPKKNLHNSGTRRKLAIRQSRLAAELEKDFLLTQEDCETWRMAAEMCSHDVAFYSCWDENGEDAGLSFCLCMNDIFGPAADCETIPFDNIPEVYDIWKGVNGESRLIEYVSKKRGVEPWDKCYENRIKTGRYFRCPESDDAR